MAESGEKPKKSKEERAKAFWPKALAPNAVFLFDKAIKIAAAYISSTQSADRIDVKPILDQMLHSIHFLGYIHVSWYLPDWIFADEEMLHRTSKDFPGPFRDYRTHVALRTPFSYFLELVTICCGHNENRVKNTLSEILRGCEKSGDRYPLISVVICICESGASRYYGASLSCEGERERKIMTAVSCVHVWHLKVSSAVMSVFPDGTGEPRRINLPDTVRCRAYAVEDIGQLKPPCKRCNQLYSLPGHTCKENPPGNCAETEAISKLLNAEVGVSDRTTISGGVYDHQEIKQRMTNLMSIDISRVYSPQ